MLLRFLLRVLFPTFRMRLDDIHSPRPSVLTSLPDLWLGYTESGTQKKYMHAELLCSVEFCAGFYLDLLFIYIRIDKCLS